MCRFERQIDLQDIIYNIIYKMRRCKICRFARCVDLQGKGTYIYKMRSDLQDTSQDNRVKRQNQR